MREVQPVEAVEVDIGLQGLLEVVLRDVAVHLQHLCLHRVDISLLGELFLNRLQLTIQLPYIRTWVIGQHGLFLLIERQQQSLG